MYKFLFREPGNIIYQVVAKTLLVFQRVSYFTSRIVHFLVQKNDPYKQCVIIVAISFLKVLLHNVNGFWLWVTKIQE